MILKKYSGFKKVAIALLLPLSIFSVISGSSGKVTDEKIREGWIYSGDMKNNRFDGKGILQIKELGEFKGSFKDGVFHGEGEFKSEEGWIFSSDFKSGKSGKKSTLILENSSIYSNESGSWKEREE